MEDDDLGLGHFEELGYYDGFVYMRKRRRPDQGETSVASTVKADQAAADAEHWRRERKKRTLLKLKTKYEKEISDWDNLSNTLRSRQETAIRVQQEQRGSEQKQNPSIASTSSPESVGGSLLDDFLLQEETREAIIHDISNFCEIAEAVCFKREEQFKQSLFDLPIWASPLELMEVLCDD